jgi:gamma-glutamyltranspeptidase
MARIIGRLRREKDEVVAPHGAVTAKHPLAADAALEVLERGGNAVDAAVVASLCTGVLLPHASGIGGGGYLVFHHSPTGETHVVDYANESPGAAHAEMFHTHPDGGFGSSQGWRETRTCTAGARWRCLARWLGSRWLSSVGARSAGHTRSPQPFASRTKASRWRRSWSSRC